MSRPAKLAIAVLAALALADLALDDVSGFWDDNPLLAGFVSGAALLWVTVAVVDSILTKREEQRSARVANQLGAMLARQARRVVDDARKELAAMGEEREKERQAAKEAEEEAREKARSSRTLRQRIEDALSFGEWTGPMDPLTRGSLRALGLYMEVQASRATQRELMAVVERRTAELEAGLATAVPFLAPREDGRECIEAGFDLVDRLHEAGRAGSIETAERKLAGSEVRAAVNRFAGLAARLGKT